MEDCIAAIATFPAPAGISVIRISGDNSIYIASKLFKASSGQSLTELNGYQAAYGQLFDGEEMLDDGVALVYRAPNSYTGEDVVEISCHGGVVLTQKILEVCFECGARPAQNGEFTKRAFLNGKMTLTQAEAVMDLINAQSFSSIKAANNVKKGILYKKIKSVCDKITQVDGHIQAWLDYPDEDVDMIDKQDIKSKLCKVKDELFELILKYKFSRVIKSGVQTVIIGKPNVGKSTIMNLLSESDKSIVTNVCGTTRDIVEETIQIDGISFILFDTAGIRETDDPVEKIGVKKAKSKINEADLILFVVDSSKKLCDDDFKAIENCGEVPIICVLNKSDIGCIDVKNYKDRFCDIISTSKTDLKSIQSLKKKMLDIYNLSSFDYSAPMLANERQRLAVLNAKKEVENALDLIDNGLTWDVIGVTLESAVDYLLELTGESVSEHVLNEVFSKFCVGK